MSGCSTSNDDQFVAAAPQQIFQGPPIKPGDILNVAVEGEDELDGQYVVQEGGIVVIPLIGPVIANGDVAAFKISFRQRLLLGFFKHSMVTVALAGHESPAGPPSPPAIRKTDYSTGSY